ncbi:hypothetical protein [uncultured Nonlabens sp.]|uniref:hypothetical protein n=1 Tax=uncultured Nonlabens sp. TaxID=859306 RepID=UPI002607A8E1|nr:hypothetical protein [uncultured Nonlabens sp.]
MDLYKELELDKFFLGGVIKKNNLKVDLNSQNEVKETLNEALLSHNLNSLEYEWNEVEHKNFEKMFISGLQYNLGFTTQEVMPIEVAKKNYSTLIENFSLEKCKFYTNWFGSPWDENGASSFNSISDYTLDMAISIISSDKLLIIYFLFED